MAELYYSRATTHITTNSAVIGKVEFDKKSQIYFYTEFKFVDPFAVHHTDIRELLKAIRSHYEEKT